VANQITELAAKALKDRFDCGFLHNRPAYGRQATSAHGGNVHAEGGNVADRRDWSHLMLDFTAVFSVANISKPSL